MTGISRRNLLKGAAFSAAGVAALGLAGCAPQTEATKAEAGLAETGETAKHTWEVKPEPIAADQISQTVDTEVLVIGGGDGGCVRELCRYKHIEHIDLVEIDERVVAVCKEYLPGVACSLDDPRVHILYQDGLKYIRRIEDEYDLIIIDSTDPFGPGEGLFTMEFYGNCYKALHEHGVLVNQHESPFYRGDALACQRAHRNIVHSFELSRLFQAHIPTYPSGHWLFGFSSRGVHPVRDLDPDWWNSLGLETGYYNTNLHKGAFYLPNYVQKLLEKVEE